MIANLIVGIIAVLLCLFAPNKRGLIASFIVVTAFLAFRFEWGNDYDNYLKWFYEVKNYGLLAVLSNEELSYHGEFLWSALYVLFKPIGFFGFVIVITIFENWVVYRVISKHVDEKFYWLSMFFYVLTTETFAVGASMMRQYFCICCFMIVVELMLERKLVWSIVIILLCSLVHRSNIFALAFLPIFYINIKTKKISLPFYFIFALVFLIWYNIPADFISSNVVNFLSVFLSDDLSDYYLHYSDRTMASANTGYGQIFSFIVFITTIYVIPKASKEHQSLLLFFLLSYFFTPLMRFIPMIYRYSLYCMVYTCVVWPLLFKYIKTKPVIIALTAGQMVITLKTFNDFFHSPIWIERFMDYQTIFEAGGWM